MTGGLRHCLSDVTCRKLSVSHSLVARSLASLSLPFQRNLADFLCTPYTSLSPIPHYPLDMSGQQMEYEREGGDRYEEGE